MYETMCGMCVCLDMLGTLLFVYIMYAWTCYAWMLEHVTYVAMDVCYE
jgi:hypothetical protein